MNEDGEVVRCRQMVWGSTVHGGCFHKGVRSGWEVLTPGWPLDTSKGG